MRVNTTSEIWTGSEKRILSRLNSPAAIQNYLDETQYSSDPFYRSPRRVLSEGKAHCFDGALLAAAALQRLGYSPLIIELKAVRDDDHLLALYTKGRGIGAISKSNFTGLRYREPIYRTLRELALSYFELYYNLQKEKTLRSYSAPIDLAKLDHLRWQVSDDNLEQIEKSLDRARHYPLFPAAQAKDLRPVDERTFKAGVFGSDPKGMYKAKRS